MALNFVSFRYIIEDFFGLLPLEIRRKEKIFKYETKIWVRY